MTKIFEAPRAERLTLSIEADDLALEIIAMADVTAAVATLEGSDEDLKRVRADSVGDTWRLRFPPGAGGSTSIVVGRNIRISGRGGFAASHISGGVFIGSADGRVIVNGVDVTDVVSERGGGSSKPLRAVVRVPLGTRLEAQIASGEITTRGLLAMVKAKGEALSVACEETAQLSVKTMSGSVEARRSGLATVSTMSGSVELEGASETTAASTMSGSIRVHAVDDILVNASSMSGNVRVTAAEGSRPVVNATSMSGRVLTP